MNPSFANYATRVSFNLTLTRAQVFTLWQVANDQFHNYLPRSIDPAMRGLPAEAPEGTTTNIFVPSVRGLIERGLVEHNPEVHKPGWVGNAKWYYRLTPEGELVYALVKAAGLCADVKPAANDKPKRKRA